MLGVFAFLALLPAQTAKEADQFNFWLGNWDCNGIAYGAKETKTPCQNNVTLELGGHVIHEHFKGGTYLGESWSVYSPTQKVWQQTWVDSSGGYILLAGQFKDGKMALETTPKPSTPNVKTRLVYFNIEKDSFDWNYDLTLDGGKTWKLSWHLHYVRKGSSKG